MKKVMVLLCLVGVLASPVHARDYVLSILPRYFPDQLTRMMTPLAEYLSVQTGERVRLGLAKDFTDYEYKIKNGLFDIGYQNPLVFSHIVNAHEAIAMAIDKDNGASFRGLVICRPDSGIKQLSDLVGKKLWWLENPQRVVFFLRNSA